VTEPVLAAVQQWLLFTGVVAVVGCVAWRLVVAPRAARTLGESGAAPLAAIERRVARLGLITALLLVVAWMLRMVVQVLGFHFPGDPLWPDVSFLLFETFWGTVWMAQGVLIPLTAIAFWIARRRVGRPGLSAGWWAALALVLGLAATLAMSGHAMGVDSWRTLLVTADTVHTLAAGTWIGSLGVILSAGRPPGAGREAVAPFAAQLRSFSSMAVVSVTALVTMGLVLSWTHLTALSDLWTMSYGRLLTAKVALAGVVLGVGFWNWRRGLPGADSEVGAGRVRRHAVWEVSFAAGVLLLTALLVHSVKPT